MQVSIIIPKVTSNYLVELGTLQDIFGYIDTARPKYMVFSSGDLIDMYSVLNWFQNNYFGTRI